MPDTDPDETALPYVSVAEAAALLGVHRSAIYQAVEAGHLDTIKVMGKKALRRADVLAYKPRPNKCRKSQDASDRGG
ncbi:MAG TPA: helix-turn-helix domain-containing protein [Chthonomonadaceae bacterium]|nr:helix-turn-helix domain-containing protein [Chthonomonadaceae bacterium]